MRQKATDATRRGVMSKIFTALCWMGAGMLTIMLAVHFLSPWQWLVIHGDSVRSRLALMVPPDFPLRQGDSVLLVWNGNDPNRQERLYPGMRLVKHIACGPGQQLRVTVTEVFCDETLIGTVRGKNLQGQSLRPTLFSGVIPPQQYFVMGDNPASYDSRYLGLVPADWIKGRLVFSL